VEITESVDGGSVARRERVVGRRRSYESLLRTRSVVLDDRGRGWDQWLVVSLLVWRKKNKVVVLVGRVVGCLRRMPGGS